MEKAATSCLLCHNKRHGLTKCGYVFRACFVCEHKPEEADTQLAVLNLGRRPPKHAGEQPSASLVKVSPDPPPSAPPSPPMTAPTPPQPPPWPLTASEDGTEIRAAATEIVQEEQEVDAADAVSVTDKEVCLVDAGGILSQEETDNLP